MTLLGATLAVAPIRLVTGADDPAPASIDLLTAALLAAGVVAALGLVVLGVRFLAPRITLDRDPREIAFRTLARKLGLPRAHRAALRGLAETIQTPPVALTLCRSAFTRALHASGMDAPSVAPADRARMLELEHKVFG